MQERSKKGIFDLSIAFLFISIALYCTRFCILAQPSNDHYCDGKNWVIEDSAEMNSIIASVRSRYLNSRPTPISDLYITMLIPSISNTNNSSDIKWKRGSYDPYALMYPASCVKLGYMAAAVKYCLEHGRAADCLDSHVRPMVKDSDNVQTGIVVDICSGAPNINISSSADPLFPSWYEKRNWAENYLSSHSLLGNQTLNLKTYPSNTGQNLWGAELVSYGIGRNAMNANCAANLMMEITMGSLFPNPSGSALGPTDYMKHLLNHQLFNSQSSIGFGLPPGTLLLNKIGVAYNNLNDIAYVQLPNGNYFILAIFSTGYEPTQPYPYDGSNLGVLAEMLIEEMELSRDDPIVIKKTSNSESFSIISGDWSEATAKDAFQNSYFYSSDPMAKAGWSIDVPKTNLYEICIWSPQSSDFSSSTQVNVVSYVSNDNFTLSQKYWGGRWVKLGDFYLVEGMNNNIVTITQNGAGAVAANAIKLTMWPECRHSPGALCSDFPH